MPFSPRLYAEYYNGIFSPTDATRSLKDQLHSIIRQEIDLFSSVELMNLARVVASELICTPTTANTSWEDMHKKRTAMFSWMGDAAADGRLPIQSSEIASRQLAGLNEIINSIVDMFLTYYEIKK